MHSRRMNSATAMIVGLLGGIKALPSKLMDNLSADTHGPKVLKPYEMKSRNTVSQKKRRIKNRQRLSC